MLSVPDAEHCISTRAWSPFGMSYLPNVPDLFESSGTSSTKIAYYETIWMYDYRRPLHNMVQNNKESEDGIVYEFVTV